MIVSSRGPLNPGQLDGSLFIDPSNLRFGEISSSPGADVGQSTPFIHTVLANADLDVESIVVFRIDASFGQVLRLHKLMRFLAALNLCDQSSTSFGKLAHTTTHEALPPFV